MEQKNISFGKGIHRTPSIGDAGELSESMNLIPSNGELVNIQQPVELYGLDDRDYRIVATHDVVKAGDRKTMYFLRDSYNLYWSEDPSTVTSSTEHISIANSLSESISIEVLGNIAYISRVNKESIALLWNGTTYKNVTSLPDLQISFGLNCTQEKSDEVTINGVSTGTLSDENKIKLTDAVIGQINKLIAEEATNKGKFIHPFLITYAYELYDGTIVRAAQPVMMVPDTSTGVHTFYKVSDGNTKIVSAGNFASIEYKIISKGTFTNFKDIITGINVYISEPLTTLNANDKINSVSTAPTEQSGSYYVGNISNGSSGSTRYYMYQPNQLSGKVGEGWTELNLPKYSKENVSDKASSCSLFYKIKSFTLDDIMSCPIDSSRSSAGRSLEIKDDTLVGLLGGEVLPSIAFDRTKISSAKNKSYNSRFNLFGVTKTLFREVYPTALFPIASKKYPDKSDDDVSVSIYIYVNESGANQIIKTYNGLLSSSCRVFYLFYPDGNAKKALIRSVDGTKAVEVSLKRNDLLGGASFSSMEGVSLESYSGVAPTESENTSKYIDNVIYTTKANNPWAIEARNTLPCKTIHSIDTTTKALSQGQFGQYPLYAFCDNGIWAMELSNDGTYSTKQPVSRDVVSVVSSVTQLDNAIAFITKEGVKILSGSEVLLISENVHGLNLKEDFIEPTLGRTYESLYRVDTDNFISQIQTEGTCMVYDYAHQLIHLFIKGVDWHYVFSRKSNEWGKQINIRSVSTQSRVNVSPGITPDLNPDTPELEPDTNESSSSSGNGDTIGDNTEVAGTTGSTNVDGELLAFVPGYPFSIVQFEKKLYKYDIATDVKKKGFALTRSYACDNPFARKVLYDLRTIGQKHTDTSISVAVFESNDNINWSRMKSLKGHSAKFYRFLILTDMYDTDTLTGMTLLAEERFSNKLR